MLLLLVKLTILLLAGLGALRVTRNADAAQRHLLGVVTMAVSLLLPLALLAPVAAIPFTLRAASSAGLALQASSTAAFRWGPLTEAIWAAGTVLMLVRLGIGYWRLTGDADVKTPIARGLLRPSILLPDDFGSWPEERKQAALRHERAHIERHDLWTNLLANVVCAVYWFHPLIWVMNARLREAQEAACDDAVLSTGFDRTAYAEALLAVAAGPQTTVLAGCPMTSKRGVAGRIVRVLAAPTAYGRGSRRAAAMFALFSIALLAPVRAETIYNVGGDVTAPRVLEKIDPDYTPDARDAKISGSVALSCVIRPDGRAHDITITRSLEPGLDRKAAEAIEQWHFAPGTHNGEPVTVRATIEVNFRVE